MTVERLSVEMPLSELLSWQRFYRVEDEAHSAARSK